MKNQRVFFNKLIDQVNSLDIQINNILKITENNDNQKSKTTLNEIKNNNINEIVNLIKLKFENGKNFSLEIDVLSNSLGQENIAYIEKLYMLNNSNFRGNEKLLLAFNNESNYYISKFVINENNFLKPLLSLIEIKPSKKNNLSNEILIKINKINEFIINNNYEKALMVLKSLSSHKNFFDKTLEQVNTGKIFYTTLNGIIKND